MLASNDREGLEPLPGRVGVGDWLDEDVPAQVGAGGPVDDLTPVVRPDGTDGSSDSLTTVLGGSGLDAGDDDGSPWIPNLADHEEPAQWEFDVLPASHIQNSAHDLTI